jgi:diguanylate cyclase (GGDEF)-like protein/PAS domain S-box-containing protein
MNLVSLPAGYSLQGASTFAAWLDQIPDALFVTDAGGLIQYVNPAFEALTGYPRDDAVGRKPSFLKSGAQDDEYYRGLWRCIQAGQPFRGELSNRKRNGELIYVENVLWPVVTEHGRIANFVCQIRDVTMRVREVQNLAHAATHDPLTELPNRNVFLDRLGLALRQAARRRASLAVAILDVDSFRDINRRYGHLGGDAVLQSVARRSASCVREVDTVARVGGDEIALILLDTSEQAGVVAVFEKIRAANAVPIRYRDRLIQTGVSIGVSIYPRDSIDSETLRMRADKAMYAAKRAGGNCVRLHRARVAEGARHGANATA